MLIRTFSKTMGAAGIRLGYLMAAQDYIDQVRKLMVPFLLNRFTLAALPLVLSDEKAKQQFQQVVDMTIIERDRLANELSTIGQKSAFQVKNSSANFLLIRFSTQDTCLAMYNHLVKSGILVRNISGGLHLTGCLRLTVGTEPENTRIIETFKAFRAS
jgi:histidinol-phosphate aminotransferase